MATTLIWIYCGICWTFMAIVAYVEGPEIVQEQSQDVLPGTEALYEVLFALGLGIMVLLAPFFPPYLICKQIVWFFREFYLALKEY